MSTTSPEVRARAYGRELFARIDREGPVPFSPGWLDQQLMDLTMSSPELKLQLFRFIDALPLLSSSASVAEHLHEYLGEAGTRLPWPARVGLRLWPRAPWADATLAWAARFNAERFARRFIVGTNVHEALDAVTRLRAGGFAFTVDLLGEATITEKEADDVQGQYLELIDHLARNLADVPELPNIDRDHLGPIPRANVSVKLSALYSQFDPIDPVGTSRAVCERLRPILRSAQQHGAFVNFDMEQYSYKDQTLRIFREILTEPEFRNWPDVGIAIQAYLRDTEQDLIELRDWARERGTQVWVRLVKGAYWDYETVIAAQESWPVPVFTRKWESDVCFERSGRFLLENYRILRPAFGSHNVRSLATMLASVEQLGIPKPAVEFQLLYGMGEPLAEPLRSLGHRVRFYTPYGKLLPGMAYLVRRLLENTSNESFLRASFSENLPEEQLLMNPEMMRPSSDVSPDTAVDGSARSGSTFRNEPLSDFTQEKPRRWMTEALQSVEAQLGRSWQLVIDGHEQAGSSIIESVSPSRTSRRVATVAAATPDQARAAITAAKNAFPKWRDTHPRERAEYLFKIAAIFRRRRFEIAAWEVYECAKPWREADADVAEAIDFCEYYGREMIRLSEPRRRDVPGEENVMFYEPRGVSVVIAPWNFPLAILCGMTTAALVAGNTVVMKPAEQSSAVGGVFMDVIREAGVPDGVVNFLPGVGEEIGPVLVDHPDVAVIAFTGSQAVGLSIYKSAAEVRPGQDHVKQVICEMGGKNATIIDADADPDEAVKGVVDSAFGYAGQKCSACSRAIVLEPIYDRFLDRLIEATRSVTIAPAEDAGCKVPPVIDIEARDRILAAIEKGKQEARLVFAGELGELAEKGSFVAPHVFADVDPSAWIAQEEIFGPVLAVIKARDLEHALEIANGTRYALTGGIFSRSPENIREVTRRFRVGNLYVNRMITGALVDRQPFGGFKMSGIGSKAGGPDYLLQFLLPRAVCENTLRHGFAPGVGE